MRTWRSPDPSYHLPAFYELWRAGVRRKTAPSGPRPPTWSRDLFQKITGPETGLTPDTAYFDETQMTGFNGAPAAFGYDSWRSVSNWAVDIRLVRKDPATDRDSERPPPDVPSRPGHQHVLRIAYTL